MTCRISAERSFMSESVLWGGSHLASEARLSSRTAQPTKYYLDKMLRKNEHISNVHLVLSVI